MPVGRMLYRKLNTIGIYKWSGIGQENAFLLATNLGTEVMIDYDCDVTNISSGKEECIEYYPSMENWLEPLILTICFTNKVNDCMHML